MTWFLVLTLMLIIVYGSIAYDLRYRRADAARRGGGDVT